MSLSANGIPCNGPRLLPAAISASAARACRRASSNVGVMNARVSPSKRSMRAISASVSSTGESLRAATSCESSAIERSCSSVVMALSLCEPSRPGPSIALTPPPAMATLGPRCARRRPPRGWRSAGRGGFHGVHDEGRVPALLRGHRRQRGGDPVPARRGRQPPELVAAGAGVRRGVSLRHGRSAQLRPVPRRPRRDGPHGAGDRGARAARPPRHRARRAGRPVDGRLGRGGRRRPGARAILGDRACEHGRQPDQRRHRGRAAAARRRKPAAAGRALARGHRPDVPQARARALVPLRADLRAEHAVDDRVPRQAHEPDHSPRALRRHARADDVPDQRRGRAHLARAVGDGAPARAGLALRARPHLGPLDLLRAAGDLQSRSRRLPEGASAMKWCRFQSGKTVAYGIIDGTTVTEVTGSPFESYAKTANTSILSRVKLLVPVIPPTFYAAGINYREHVIEMAQRRGVKPEFPPAADVGYRANNALVATDEPIVIPKDATDLVQYEGELVVVIGKRCKKVSEAQALDYVFGYTLGNDVSERTWQRGDRTFWRGKNTDTFKPMGPWIVTGLNPDDLRVTIRLNGKEMFTYAVKDAIFGVRQFISRMSQYLTLYPGDVLWMGTDGATENMKDGDVVEVEVLGIGVLRNPVVRER